MLGDDQIRADAEEAWAKYLEGDIQRFFKTKDEQDAGHLRFVVAYISMRTHKERKDRASK